MIIGPLGKDLRNPDITHLVLHHGHSLTFELGVGQTEPGDLFSHTYSHILDFL